MKYIDLVKSTELIETKSQVLLEKEEKTKDTKNTITPESLLRQNNFKIKIVTPTSFGVQIDFAKKYKEEEIKAVLKDYNIKIKDKAVFIIY